MKPSPCSALRRNPTATPIAPWRCCASTGIAPSRSIPPFPKSWAKLVIRSVAEIAEPIDTITIYLGKQRSDPLIDEIIAAKPNRIIMNPGAENDELAEQARAAGIEVDYACTLVMLQSGTW